MSYLVPMILAGVVFLLVAQKSGSIVPLLLTLIFFGAFNFIVLPFSMAVLINGLLVLGMSYLVLKAFGR